MKSRKPKKIVVLPALAMFALLLMAALTVGNVKPSHDPSDPSFANCRPAALCHEGEEYPILADLIKSPTGGYLGTLAITFETDGGYLGNSNVATTFTTDGGYLGNSA